GLGHRSLLLPAGPGSYRAARGVASTPRGTQASLPSSLPTSLAPPRPAGLLRPIPHDQPFSRGHPGLSDAPPRHRAIDPNTRPRPSEPAAADRGWQGAWQASRIYHYDAGRARSETFVIDTPPPTASGSLHPGHVFSYTHTDLVARFRRMSGQNVFYPMGWDDNGLPTERRVQNYFHIRCDPSMPYEPGLELFE